VKVLENWPPFDHFRLSEFLSAQNQRIVLPAITQLLNRCFDCEHYTENFPTVFQDLDPRWSFVGICANKIVSFCHVSLLNWQPANNLKQMVGCLGSVATHPDFQKRAYGSRLVRLAETACWQASLDGICLFSDRAEFYLSRGYRHLGTEQLMQLEHQIFEVPQSENEFRLISNSRTMTDRHEQVEIWQLLSRSPFDSILSFQDFALLLQVPGVAVATVRDKSKIRAMGLIGKGIDFQNVLHSVVSLENSDRLELVAGCSRVNRTLAWLTNAQDNDIISHGVAKSVYFKSNPDREVQRTAERFDRGLAYVRGVQSS
jgi:predicted N-acetyltransferase YhbS